MNLTHLDEKLMSYVVFECLKMPCILEATIMVKLHNFIADKL